MSILSRLFDVFQTDLHHRVKTFDYGPPLKVANSDLYLFGSRMTTFNLLRLILDILLCQINHSLSVLLSCPLYMHKFTKISTYAT